MDPQQSITPPKSADKIRATLDAIQQAEVATAEVGAGMSRDDQLSVWSFHDPHVCYECQQFLLAEGVFSATRQNGPQMQMMVDYSDRVRAVELIGRFMVGRMDRPRKGRSMSLDFMLEGALSAVTVASLPILVPLSIRSAAVAIVLVAIYGTALGLFVCMRRARRGRRWFQIHVLDLLLWALTVGLVLFVWRVSLEAMKMTLGR